MEYTAPPNFAELLRKIESEMFSSSFEHIAPPLDFEYPLMKVKLIRFTPFDVMLKILATDLPLRVCPFP